MTYSEFITKLRYLLNDTRKGVFTDDELFQWVNQGILEVSQESIAKDDRDFKVSGYISYGQDLPDNFVRFAGGEQVAIENGKTYPAGGTISCSYYCTPTLGSGLSSELPLGQKYHMRIRLKAVSYAMAHHGYDTQGEVAMADRLLSTERAAAGIFPIPEESGSE